MKLGNYMTVNENGNLTGNFLPLAGGTLTGDLTLSDTSSLLSGGSSLEVGGTNATTEIIGTTVTIKSTVADIVVSGNPFGTPVKIQGVETPTNDTDAANKSYVDGKYTYSTTDLEAGVSSLATGKLYFVYE